MGLHALYVGGQPVEITCGYSWTPPKVSRVGTTQYTPYGAPWDDGQDEQGNAVYRAEPSDLVLTVGGKTAVLAANAAEEWTQRVLAATRLVYLPTGRFMQLLLVRGVGAPEVTRATSYKTPYTLEYLDPYWHDTVGDGSTRRTP